MQCVSVCVSVRLCECGCVYVHVCTCAHNLLDSVQKLEDGHIVCVCTRIYSTCHKKLYEIRRFSAASPRISAESCTGVRGIEQGCPRNRARVSAESCKGVRGIVKGCPRNRERVSAES